MNLQLENVIKVGRGDIYALTIFDPNLEERFTFKFNKSNKKEDLLIKIKAAHLRIIQKNNKIQAVKNLLESYINGLDSSEW